MKTHRLERETFVARPRPEVCWCTASSSDPDVRKIFDYRQERLEEIFVDDRRDD